MPSSAPAGVACAAVSFVLVACGSGCTSESSVPSPVDSRPEQSEPPNPYRHSRSRFGSVPLHAGFNPDPKVVSGQALGEVAARSIHRKCEGWVSETPDYLLQAESAFFKLYVLGRSLSDVTLIVRKPDGSVLCNDDRRGTIDPMIRSNFPIGTTQIWVGVKEKGASARYRLGFSEVKWKPSSIALPEER